MRRVGASLAAMAVSWAMVQPAHAAEPAPDLAALQREVADMRRDYEAQIGAPEARLKAAEEAAGVLAPVQTQSGAQSPEVPPGVAPGEVVIADTAPSAVAETRTLPGNASNPGVSVVLNGNYFAASRDPALARIP